MYSNGSRSSGEVVLLGVVLSGPKSVLCNTNKATISNQQSEVTLL